MIFPKPSEPTQRNTVMVLYVTLWDMESELIFMRTRRFQTSAEAQGHQAPSGNDPGRRAHDQPGRADVAWLDDEWTVVTMDGSLSAHYENYDPHHRWGTRDSDAYESVSSNCCHDIGGKNVKSRCDRSRRHCSGETCLMRCLKVELENKHVVLAHISGKLRMNFYPYSPGR